jgi:hypothetical protein
MTSSLLCQLCHIESHNMTIATVPPDPFIDIIASLHEFTSSPQPLLASSP